MKAKKIICWILRLVVAVILLQTLYFKFTASPESVFIFTQLGIEPWGRVGTGIIELIASILILFPKTTVYGALMAMGTMAGAIFSHLTKLGVVVANDGGELFILACIVFVCSSVLVYVNRNQLISLFVRS
ncbi:DoxX family membrane protein [Pedobacter sp. LMG 31464]|uniref:DoxX family membrane protein n=1 Tax=Pedobacter planticolens TaxID=2679964 RepID=A0A923E3I7_9SPHI|nr:DoxX family protein [Pedobacter planticolens]MBB2146844.1 DoxX family membrane protein [Pedobacter planticolens]